jgi:hypothetical protein
MDAMDAMDALVDAMGVNASICSPCINDVDDSLFFLIFKNE